MQSIKQLIENNHITIKLLAYLTALGCIFLSFRIILSQSLFFSFLLWNICLAYLPLGISLYLKNKAKHNTLQLLIWLAIWLLFLPNAPYIITDFMHLRLSTKHMIWLDVLILTTFASNGLFLFFLTVLDIKHILENHLNYRLKPKYMYVLFVLVAFGIYLGRFLRHNSWELINKPLLIFNDIKEIMIHPIIHFDAWLFTFCFSIFLGLGFYMFNTISNRVKSF